MASKMLENTRKINKKEKQGEILASLIIIWYVGLIVAYLHNIYIIMLFDIIRTEVE